MISSSEDPLKYRMCINAEMYSREVVGYYWHFAFYYKLSTIMRQMRTKLKKNHFHFFEQT
jgi:hypothetical protein